MGWQRFNRATNVFEVSDDNGATWQTLKVAADGISGLGVPLHIQSADSQVALIMGPSAAGPALRSRNIDTVDVVSGDNQVFRNLSANSFYAWGGGNNFADLTVRGATDCNSLTVSNGDNSITGYTTIVSNLSRSADASLFLWNKAAGGTQRYRLMSYENLFRIWNGDNNAELLFIDGAGVMKTFNTIHVGGALQTRGGYIYPGDISQASVPEQASWLFAGHSSYGMYCNTGMYLESGIWTNAVESRNHLRAAAGLYDYSRGTPIGEWTNFSPSISGNGTLVGLYTCKYMLVGKTLVIKLNIVVTSNVVNFAMVLPAGLTNRAEYCNDVFMFADGQTVGQGMAQASPNDVWMYFYKNILANANWVGNVTVVGTLTVPVY